MLHVLTIISCVTVADFYHRGGYRPTFSGGAVFYMYIYFFI